MKISRYNTVGPVIVIDDFLPEASAAEVLDECIELKPIYHQAGVISKKPGVQGQGGLIDKNMRKNEAVFIDKIFDKNAEKSRILKHVFNGNFKRKLKDTWREGDTCFDIINYANRFETVLSRYGDGDFYNYHLDSNGTFGNRVITAVYYVQKPNVTFTGGELVLKRNDQELAIPPSHNKLVVFRSDTLHKVQTVKMLSDKFEDSRFSVNIWIGFKE